jgi:hypothetical protein
MEKKLLTGLVSVDWKEKEKSVRRELEKEFGVPLKERAVPLRGAKTGYKFDCVSSDGSIVAEVKTYKSPTSGGKRPSAKIAHASDACLLLMATEKAKRKLLIFTNRNFYELYKSERQGQIAESNGIEIRLIEV